MADDADSQQGHAVKDGNVWRIGSQVDVAWIVNDTQPGLAITSGIPPVFDAYATVVVPEDDVARWAAERALVKVLTDESTTESWWLGYLDTGASDVVFPDAPMVQLYTGWRYVLVQAGPIQAATWRVDSPFRGTLPDLMFPADHAWLVSRLWDDDWHCVGGPARLIERLLADPALVARSVGTHEDATPPGHIAY